MRVRRTTPTGPAGARSAQSAFKLQPRAACSGAVSSVPERESRRAQTPAARALEPASAGVVHQVLRQPGEALDTATRGFMEPPGSRIQVR